MQWRKGIPNANALVVLLLGLPVASEPGEAWREFVRQMGWDGLARAAFDIRGDDLLLFVSGFIIYFSIGWASFSLYLYI